LVQGLLHPLVHLVEPLDERQDVHQDVHQDERQDENAVQGLAQDPGFVAMEQRLLLDARLLGTLPVRFLLVLFCAGLDSGFRPVLQKQGLVLWYPGLAN
jgi:hypothetical protein